MKIKEVLVNIQAELKAPKAQYNDFGKYKYRSCEDILEAVKPILKKYNTAITLSDDILNIGNRFYIKATATLFNGEELITSEAYAREDEAKKGMDGSQITGSASSYARKYALNGLLAIDDTKDADTYNKHNNDQSTTENTEIRCYKCGKVIKSGKTRDGKITTPEEISKMTGGLCITCARVVSEQ